MTARQKYPASFHVRTVYLLLTALLFLLPAEGAAEPSLFLRIVEELEYLDLNAIRDLKLSAKLKTDSKGKIVFQCLNVSLPMTDNLFVGMGSRIKFNQIEIKGVNRGVIARVAFSF